MLIFFKRYGLRIIAFFTAFALGLSTRYPLFREVIIGTGIYNDFTTGFIYLADLAVMAFAAWLILARDMVALRNKFLLALIAYVAIVTVSLIAAPAESWLGVLFVLRLLAASLLFYFSLSAQGAFKNFFLWGLVVAGALNSCVAIIQFTLQGSTGLFLLGESPLVLGSAGIATFHFLDQHVLRSYGLLQHPNILAYFLLLGLWSLYALWLEHKLKVNKWLFYGLFILLSAGLISTFSRLGLAAALVGGLFIWQSATKSKPVLLGIASLICVTIFIGFLSIRGQDTSLSLRSVYSDTALKQIRESPVLGTGPGQSVLRGNAALQQALDEKNISYQVWMHQPVHNSYLLVAAESGWFGLLAWLLFIYLFFRQFYSSLNIHAKALFIFLVCAPLTDHMFWTSPALLYGSFILFGLLASSSIKTGESLDMPLPKPASRA